MNSVKTVIKRNTRTSPLGSLPRPEYVYRANGPRICLAVERMKRHMTDEGWQIAAGLEYGGFKLYGYSLPNSQTNVATILNELEPHTVVIQDKREWEGLTADKPRDPRMRFRNVESLEARQDIFKVTILKDAQNNGPYHCQSAREIGCHAWIVYYHPLIVSHLAPYVRVEDCIRVYHSLDMNLVPPFSQDRNGAILSGALSRAYPLRVKLVHARSILPETTWLKHPGYTCGKCYTPDYLQTLSKYKVAICTCSRYGYALRRIMEATACGCRVITDLPVEDQLPYIDENLYRISHTCTVKHVARAVQICLDTYDSDKQWGFAQAAMNYYDYRMAGLRLTEEIEERRGYYANRS